MYFHVLKNVKVNGVQGYKHIRTYQKYGALLKWLLKTGEPVWVIESKLDHLPLFPYRRDGDNNPIYGGFTASYWNTGGWGTATLPKMPLF